MADPPSAIGVVIVDDHQMFAESLARLLTDEDGITVLGIATSGLEGVELAARLKPNVVLIDFQMPERDGVVIAAEIKRRDPAIMVVMLTGSTEDRVLVAAIDAGCSGFLTTDLASAEVVTAVRAAAAGEALISPTQLARLSPRLNRTHRSLGSDLTDHEREILRLLAQGRTNKVIAGELFLSVNTVRNYVQSVLSKLGAHSS
jgi:DNA-binding NarL/FixJ family response regulator